MPLPLYGFVHGDTLGLVVLAAETETVHELAGRLARAAAPRVSIGPSARVVHRGKVLRPELTLLDAGVAALDRVDLMPEAELD